MDEEVEAEGKAVAFFSSRLAALSARFPFGVLGIQFSDNREPKSKRKDTVRGFLARFPRLDTPVASWARPGRDFRRLGPSPPLAPGPEAIVGGGVGLPL